MLFIYKLVFKMKNSIVYIAHSKLTKIMVYSSLSKNKKQNKKQVSIFWFVTTKKNLTMLSIHDLDFTNYCHLLYVCLCVFRQAVRPEIGQASSLLDIGTRSIFGEEHDIFRQNVRRFMNEEIAPHQKRYIG